MPKETVTTDNDKEAVDEAFITLLKEMRYGTMNITEPRNKRKIEVVAGRSVCEQDVGEVVVPAKKNKTVKSSKHDNTLPSTS